MDAEVIVVGAGPGGSSAALHLARRGRRVLLLDRQTFPRDKSCGDGLTRFCVRLLAEMDVLPLLKDAQVTGGARVFMRGRGSRDFAYPDPGPRWHGDMNVPPPGGGMVVPRFLLDDLLRRQAVAEGADFRADTSVSNLIYDDDVVVGVNAVHGGVAEEVYAPIVVAADGAASRLAYQAGLVDTPRDRLGYAIRGYYDGVEGLDDLLEIYMPLMDPTDRFILPSYGWVFPTGPATANIGVGIVRREYGTNVKELMTRFVEYLQESDPRFRKMQAAGTWRGAPLRFDFAPQRCTAPGLLLVGDAAGMISPFTGEGIGYALESGKLAAEAVDRHLESGTNGLSDYSDALAKKYTGYFETGRQSARRYLLVWHVLESTFQNDKPLFSMSRQAALFPEGLGESYAKEVLKDVGPLMTGSDGSLRSDLFAIGEMLIDIVRRDWPFLAHLVTADEMTRGVPFRPALFLLLSGRIGAPRSALLVQVGAAVELGYLAALAQTSVGDEPGPADAAQAESSANWGNMFALMVSDFLLSKAYALSAQVATEVSREIAAGLSRACEGYTRALRNAYNPDLSPDEHLDILAQKSATLFALPCRLGARLSGLPVAQINSLTTYGRHLGLAFQIRDDILALSGENSQMGQAVASRLDDGVYSLPIVLALQSAARDEMRTVLDRIRRGDAGPEDAYRLVRESGSVDGALRIAHDHAVKARRAVEGVPACSARSGLTNLVHYALYRQTDLPLEPDTGTTVDTTEAWDLTKL